VSRCWPPTRRWLGFGPEAVAAGAATVFSLPLQVCAMRLGTLDLHRDFAGGLSGEQLADAVVLASLATETLVEFIRDLASGAGDDSAAPVGPAGGGCLGWDPEPAGWLPSVHAAVHQACGMLAALEDIDVGDALLVLRAYAFAHGEPIEQVARRVIAHDLVLSDHDPTTGPAGPDG
jgi:hypothetical protein